MPLKLVLLVLMAPFAGGHASVTAIVVGSGEGIMECLAYWLFFLAIAAGPITVVSPLVAVAGCGYPGRRGRHVWGAPRRAGWNRHWASRRFYRADEPGARYRGGIALRPPGRAAGAGVRDLYRH